MKLNYRMRKKHLFTRNASAFIVLLFVYCFSIFFCRILLTKIIIFIFNISCILSRYVLGSKTGLSLCISKSNNGCLGKIIENPLNSNMPKEHVLIISTDTDNEFITKIIPVVENNTHKICVPHSNCYAGMCKTRSTQLTFKTRSPSS